MTDVKNLSLEEKAGLTSGASFWYTKPVETAGIPAIMVADGPHGLRKQSGEADHMGLNDSVPATCFPPAVGLASSWDVELFAKVGKALSVEASIEDVSVLLGPGVNIKRSLLCGRNFEYLSEDPIVSGVLGAAYINAVQGQGIGTSVKHFAANNQEDDRMRSSSEVDERTLHEIYLRGFERIVRDSQPWTVMCSYNKINGVYASQDKWLLTEVLRDQWGFEGLVVSDWGAVADRVAALEAGLDLQMPATGGASDAEVVAAVHAGSLDEHVVDTSAQRVVDLVEKATAAAVKVAGPLDVEAQHAIAREAAGRSIVLLRNEGGILPLDASRKLAIIGAFAETPRYQGAGSSRINPTRLDNALDAIREVASDVSYAPGFSISADVAEGENEQLRADATSIAAEADAVVLFLGLPGRLESEGFDRKNIDLPIEQLELVDAVVAANPNVVVVLSNGGVVALPFKDTVPAIVEAWLLGQAGGGATADVLFGAVNPSGKLTETIPHRLEDSPAYLNFPGEFGKVHYGEGIFVGYRWYDARKFDVAYPFGHGLSYTTFEYGEASAVATADGDVAVTFTLTNTGSVAGREIVQVYTSRAGNSVVQRPVRELKGFASVALDAGETKSVTVTVRREDLAYWDVRVPGWAVEGGTYTVEVAASSRDIRSTTTVVVAGEDVPAPLNRESTLGEALAHPIIGPIVREQMGAAMGDSSSETVEGTTTADVIGGMPLVRLAAMSGGAEDGITLEQIDQLIELANSGGQPGARE